MLFLATEETVRFFMFDIFMVLFTILIALGVYRLMKEPKKNKFALGFAGTSLIIFLIADLLMVLNWMGML